MIKLAIDIDGCLANFTQAFGQLLIETTSKDLFPTGWMDSLSFPGVWDWDLHAGYSLEESQEAWQKVKTDPEFWFNLEALPLAHETICRLSALEHYGHDIYFVTNRLGNKCKQQTERWLHAYGMYCPTVLVAADKTPILRSLRIDAFVDDRLDTINDVARQIEEGELHPLRVYLVDKHYNREGRRAGFKVVDSVQAMLKEEGLWQ